VGRWGMIRERSNNGVNSSDRLASAGERGGLRHQARHDSLHKMDGRWSVGEPHTPLTLLPPSYLPSTLTFLDRSRSYLIRISRGPRMLARVESSALSRCRIKASAAHRRTPQPVMGRRCETCELCRPPLSRACKAFHCIPSPPRVRPLAS
jgi:hypothetical protein